MARTRTTRHTDDDLVVTTDTRGSERLLQTWAARGERLIRDEHVEEVARRLEDSPATVSHVVVAGGTEATGLGLALTYDGDAIDRCGNDMQWLLELLRKLGTPSEPPRWIIDGTVVMDRVTVLATLGVLPANAFDAVIPKLGQQRRGRLGRHDG